MDTRQSTPDVLGSIMSGTTKQENKQASFSLEKKEKVTFNLSIELLRQLEDVWMQMRKTSSKKISKTSLVETALQQAFSELDVHREKSAFYTKLIKENKN